MVDVPKIAPAAVRVALVERAAEMLARREPVSLRSLVEGTGASTMAVYTHFGGMPGLWRAVRQEGFTRLKARLDRVRPTADPVRDLAALGAAYTGNALTYPALYRTMFDTQADLDDPGAADAAFGVLIAAAARAREKRRFAEHTDPAAVATQAWAAGHGLTMLVITGVLAREALTIHAPAILTALYVAAGDDERLCRTSVQRGFHLG
jgi:AcrR family transcriptional regulator